MLRMWQIVSLKNKQREDWHSEQQQQKQQQHTHNTNNSTNNHQHLDNLMDDPTHNNNDCDDNLTTDNNNGQPNNMEAWLEVAKDAKCWATLEELFATRGSSTPMGWWWRSSEWRLGASSQSYMDVGWFRALWGEVQKKCTHRAMLIKMDIQITMHIPARISS